LSILSVVVCGTERAPSFDQAIMLLARSNALSFDVPFGPRGSIASRGKGGRQSHERENI